LPESKRKKEYRSAESLVEVLERMDISLSKEVRQAIGIIDEKFVQGLASNRTDYLILLKDFAEELENSRSGE
jgi:hypothetical protein